MTSIHICNDSGFKTQSNHHMSYLFIILRKYMFLKGISMILNEQCRMNELDLMCINIEYIIVKDKAEKMVTFNIFYLIMWPVYSGA